MIRADAGGRGGSTRSPPTSAPRWPAWSSAPAPSWLARGRSMADETEDGLRFMHLMTSQVRSDVAEGRATLYALLEELAERGVIDLAALEERRERARVLEEERNQ